MIDLAVQEALNGSEGSNAGRNYARSNLSGINLAGARMTWAWFLHADLSGACFVEADLWSSTLTDSPYPASNMSGTNLENTGVFREESLARFPDIIHSATTRWDAPTAR